MQKSGGSGFEKQSPPNEYIGSDGLTRHKAIKTKNPANCLAGFLVLILVCNLIAILIIIISGII